MARSEKKRKIQQIMDLAVEVNKGKPSVFVQFSGHVNQVSVDIHYDGWVRGEFPTVSMRAYLSGSLSKLSDFNKIIKELKRLKVKECKNTVYGK